MMPSFLRRLAAIIFAITLATTLVSCGGSGGSGDDGGSADSSLAQGKGTVGILLTDMPADPALFDSINASIIKVELLGSDDNGRVVLYSGEAQTFDLLRLRNESIPLTFKDDVPAGKYCKIRLILSDLELVLADDTPANPDDNETYHPNLPGNGKLDLLARDCFNVVADKVVTLQVDIDAGKSIHVVGNSNGYKFRPVIFVDVIDETFESKLVRLTGVITKINDMRRSLLLCDAVPTKNMNNRGCVKVHFDEDYSAFFDNQVHGGAPRSIDELLSADKLLLEVTVVGWPRYRIDSDYDDYEPDEYYPLMQLDALVAELGGFLQVEGIVDADAVETGFDMTVSSGSPIVTDGVLAVMYQEGDVDVNGKPLFNGTRIVSKSGELLAPLDVKETLPVKVDGVLNLDSNPVLKAALVIVDKSALGSEQVTGLVLSVGTDTLTLDPEVAFVCGEEIGPPDYLTVGLADNLDILTVTIMNDRSVIKPGGTLTGGQTVGMNGNCGPDGYETDNVVIVDDQR